MVLILSPSFTHEESGKIGRLMVRWQNDRVVICELDHQTKSAHLFPDQFAGGETECPTIEWIEVGPNGVGCVIKATTAKGVSVVVRSEAADFIMGIGFNFSTTLS